MLQAKYPLNGDFWNGRAARHVGTRRHRSLYTIVHWHVIRCNLYFLQCWLFPDTPKPAKMLFLDPNQGDPQRNKTHTKVTMILYLDSSHSLQLILCTLIWNSRGQKWIQTQNKWHWHGVLYVYTQFAQYPLTIFDPGLVKFFPLLVLGVVLPRVIGGAIAVAILQKGNTELYNDNIKTLVKALHGGMNVESRQIQTVSDRMNLAWRCCIFGYEWTSWQSGWNHIQHSFPI